MSERSSASTREKQGKENPKILPLLLPLPGLTFQPGNLCTVSRSPSPLLEVKTNHTNKTAPPLNAAANTPLLSVQAPITANASIPDHRGNKRQRTMIMPAGSIGQQFQQFLGSHPLFPLMPSTPSVTPSSSSTNLSFCDMGPVAPSAADRRLQKLIRNRASAKLHRDRQKARLAELESELLLKDALIQDLRGKLEALSKDNFLLKEAMKSCTCNSNSVASVQLCTAPFNLQQSPTKHALKDCRKMKGNSFSMLEESSPDTSPLRRSDDGIDNMHLLLEAEETTFPPSFASTLPFLKVEQDCANPVPIPVEALSSPSCLESVPFLVPAATVGTPPHLEGDSKVDLDFDALAEPTELTEEDWALLEQDSLLLEDTGAILGCDFLEHGLESLDSKLESGAASEPRTRQSNKELRRLSGGNNRGALAVLFAVACVVHICFDPLGNNQNMHIIMDSPSTSTELVNTQVAQAVGKEALYLSQDLVPVSKVSSTRRGFRRPRASGRVLHMFETDQQREKENKIVLTDTLNLSQQPWLWAQYVEKHKKAPWQYSSSLDLYSGHELQMTSPGNLATAAASTARAAAVAAIAQSVTETRLPEKGLVVAEPNVFNGPFPQNPSSVLTVPLLQPQRRSPDSTYMFCPKAYGVMSSAMSSRQSQPGANVQSDRDIHTSPESGPFDSSTRDNDQYMVLLVPTASIVWSNTEQYLENSTENAVNQTSYPWIEIGCKVFAAKLVPNVHFSFN